MYEYKHALKLVLGKLFGGKPIDMAVCDDDPHAAKPSKQEEKTIADIVRENGGSMGVHFADKFRSKK